MDKQLNGYAKVGTEYGGGLVQIVLFNPDTYAVQKITYDDIEYLPGDSPFLSRTYDMMTGEELDALWKAPINEEVRVAFCVAFNVIEPGRAVEVFKGRKIPIGTIAEVKKTEEVWINRGYPMNVGTRVVFTDGRKTAIDNVRVIG